MAERDSHYRFRSTWTLDEPLGAVWAALASPTTWPRWWPGCVIVESLSGQTTPCVGNCYRFYWRGALPYCLVICICITHLDAPKRMGGDVEGPIEGRAEWRLWEDRDRTKVSFEFSVSGSKPWMRYVAPAARPLFRWNHARLMASGERGLRQWLAEHGATRRNLDAGLG